MDKKINNFRFIIIGDGRDRERALQVISEIEALLPKLDSAIDTVNNLEEVFQNLSGISEILSLLLDPLKSNS